MPEQTIFAVLPPARRTWAVSAVHGEADRLVALHDALAMLDVPVVEVHISNVFKREPFRHHSYISPVAKGVISGLGPEGYVLALQAIGKGISN